MTTEKNKRRSSPRRSIYMKSETYQRVLAYCKSQPEETRQTYSGFVEETINQKLDDLAVPMVEDESEEDSSSPDVREIMSAHFTF